MARLFDHIKITGHFNLKAYDAEGRLIDEVDGENIVVNGGREALARLVANDGGNWFPDTVKFGDGGHDPGDVTVMETALVTFTGLQGTENFSDTVTVSHPALRQVQFTATVLTSEGNGGGTAEYSEAGLFYNSGADLFAWKAFGYIVKNNTIQLDMTWTFTF